MHKKAKQIVQILREKGFSAYYAGGWVRDFLLKCDSDDIDIATSAPPEVITSLFPHTVPIGEAFGIILVVMGEHKYEVATFRKDLDYKDGRRPSSIEFTTALEDARRRDFTINGMFYDPITNEVIDYVEGQKDLENKLIRAIGNAHQRIKEDRLRMLRAVRLSARFNFAIEEETKKAIIAHANELTPFVAIERIYQEFEKMSKNQNLKKGLLMLFDFGILQNIFNLKDIDKKTLEERLLYLDFFPKDAPTIAKILDLFEDESLEAKIDLCLYLKLSSHDINFVKTFHEIKELLKKGSLTNYDYAHVYAKKDAKIILNILAAHLSLSEKKAFLSEHERKQSELDFFIKKIKNKDPILKAAHLIMEGISPGPLMGKLLMEGEKIAINQKIEEPQKIISLLKKTSLWSK